MAYREEFPLGIDATLALRIRALQAALLVEADAVWKHDRRLCDANHCSALVCGSARASARCLSLLSVQIPYSDRRRSANTATDHVANTAHHHHPVGDEGRFEEPAIPSKAPRHSGVPPLNVSFVTDRFGRVRSLRIARASPLGRPLTLSIASYRVR